jgi:gas vesicle protein
MGAILGMTILGAVGFFAFSWTIVGGIIGGAVGIALGRYAGRKLRKRIKHKGPIIEEELYRIKMKCLLKLTKIHAADLKYNLNRYRFILEKVTLYSSYNDQTLEENILSLDLTLFKEPKKIHKELLRLKETLFTVMAQKAILLSYKLFKLFLQSVDINNPKSREE